MGDAQTAAALEHRLRRLEDKEAIRDLLARYAFAADLGRMDDFLSLWTDDAVFRTDGGGELLTCAGKDEIRHHFDEALMQVPGIVGKIQHLLLSNLIELDGDSARATGFQVITRNTGSGFEVLLTSYRTYAFRRTGGRWLIEESVSISTGTVGQEQLIPTEQHWLEAGSQR